MLVKIHNLYLKLNGKDLWTVVADVCSDARRTRETLKIMQEQVQALLEAEIHFISSFYSVAAMDGQTADHLQQAICRYARDEILTVMWVFCWLVSLALYFIGEETNSCLLGIWPQSFLPQLIGGVIGTTLDTACSVFCQTYSSTTMHYAYIGPSK